MTTEGSVDPFEQNVLTSTTACFICSDISFDESLKGDFSNLSVLEYLDNKIPKSSQTYLEYINQGRELNYSKNIRIVKMLDVVETFTSPLALAHTFYITDDEFDSAIHWEVASFKGIEEVSPEKEYIVLYHYTHRGSVGSSNNLVGKIMFMIPSGKSASMILLVDKEKLPYLKCDYLAN